MEDPPRIVFSLLVTGIVEGAIVGIFEEGTDRQLALAADVCGGAVRCNWAGTAQDSWHVRLVVRKAGWLPFVHNLDFSSMTRRQSYTLSMVEDVAYNAICTLNEHVPGRRVGAAGYLFIPGKVGYERTADTVVE